VSEWQPIETSPKEGERVDVWFRMGTQAARWPNCQWVKSRQRWFGGPTDQGEGSWVATHWLYVLPPEGAQRGMEP